MEKQLGIVGKWDILGKDFTIYGTVESPLFLAKEVAERIEHSNSRMMLQAVDSSEKQCVNNPYALKGQQDQWFLTEDGLYEVLMQSRKPIAKQFKKKVKEILKEIRKTGSYQIQLKQLSNSVTLKFYNTTRVITKLDARDLLGVSENVVQYALYNEKVGCIINKDFWVLKHAELRAYIADNNPIRRTVSALIVIAESGFNKIRDFLKIANPMPFPSQTLPSTSPTQQVLPIQTSNGGTRVPLLNMKWAKELRTDVPDNPMIQEWIKQIKNKIITFEQMLESYNAYNSKHGQESLKYALNLIGADIWTQTLEMTRVKYEMVEKHI